MCVWKVDLLGAAVGIGICVNRELVMLMSRFPHLISDLVLNQQPRLDLLTKKICSVTARQLETEVFDM